MNKEKQTRIIAILIIGLLVIVGTIWFITDGTFKYHKDNDLPQEKIDSLREMIPEEMFRFLFKNDSLRIGLNSMADFHYDSKDSIINDSVILSNFIRYEFLWDSNKNNWHLRSRFSLQVDSSKMLTVSRTENYLAHNNTWELTACDSFFRNEAGEFLKEKTLDGITESYDRYENDTVKILIHTASEYSDTKIVKTKDKITGKIIKRLEFSGDNSKNEWTLKEIWQYTYEGNTKHTKIFSKEYGKEGLAYTEHDIETKINNDMTVRAEYQLDSLNHEILSDSSVHIKRQDSSRVYKHMYYSRDHKLIREDIDSSYFDLAGNHYYYTKSANYTERLGIISNGITDSLDRIKYFKSYHWSSDSSDLRTYERFGYFTPKSDISVKNSIKSEGGNDVKTPESIDIEFRIDQFTSCRAHLHWNEEDSCFIVNGIILYKFNNAGKIVKTIKIE